MEHAIIIPSLNPGQNLIDLVDELTGLGADRIVIVNDGSDKDHVHYFQRLWDYDNVVVLEHKVNLGKGEALKTAFAYCDKHYTDLTGVVTADDDGQHTTEDIMNVSKSLTANPGCLVLGVRAFDRHGTPRRSYTGNKITSRIFELLYKASLPDTQTGLRGIPASELCWLAQANGKRYEYELNMLIQCKRRNVKIVQIPIQVLYFNDNKGSHFKAVRDSLRIITLLLFNLHIGLGFARNKKPYGGLFYFSRWALRLFNKRLAIEGDVPAGPVVLVGHHQNLRGALNAMISLDAPVRLWMLDVFTDRRSCYTQYADYTFTQRLGWSKPIACVASFFASLYISRLSASMRAIPVCRKSSDVVNVTMMPSVEALCNNERVLIFPDVDYSSDSDRMGKMYTGFVHMDKFYYARTGAHIDFIPMRINAERMSISLGPPSRIHDGESLSAGKRRVCEELLDKINSL